MGNAGSVDTVVATHLLCSVDNATKVLHEVARVLKPGGKFVFLEHSLDPDSKSWRHLAQVAIAPFINILADGCKSLSIKETIMEATSSTSRQTRSQSTWLTRRRRQTKPESSKRNKRPSTQSSNRISNRSSKRIEHETNTRSCIQSQSRSKNG